MFTFWSAKKRHNSAHEMNLIAFIIVNIAVKKIRLQQPFTHALSHERSRFFIARIAASMTTLIPLKLGDFCPLRFIL